MTTCVTCGGCVTSRMTIVHLKPFGVTFPELSVFQVLERCRPLYPLIY